MKRLVLALAVSTFAAAILVPAQAQIAMPILFGAGRTAAAYTGPCDVVSGPRVWYGLRGCGSAYATGSNPAVQVQANGSAPQFTINILSNGNLDISTALSDVGTSGTGSCTISGTTMTCATGTGTLRQYGNITGAGLTLPAYITSANCSSFPCTMTLNASQTVGVAETITSYNQIAVYSWYDQSGANACSSAACNIPGSSGRSIYIINQCQNGHPCTISEGNSSTQTYNPVTNMSSTNIPVTFSVVGMRPSAISTTAIVAISTHHGTNGQPQPFWDTTANTAAVYAGSTLDATASDGTVHAMESVATTSPNCVVNVDGTETTGGCGTGAASTDVDVFSNPDLTSPMQSGAEFMEAGMWPSALSQANRSSLCDNQAKYWNTTIGTHC